MQRMQKRETVQLRANLLRDAKWTTMHMQGGLRG